MPVIFRAQFPFVGLDGVAVRDEIRREMVELWVDDHMVLPDSVYIRFRFDDPELWTGLGARIGQSLVVRAGQLGEAAESTLIEAELTSIEAVYEYGRRFLVLRGYDASHRLHIGRKTRSFNNVTDSDLARRIATDAGLRIGTVDSTTTVHDHISQINTTDWDFLRWRAHEIGFRLAVRDGRFDFTAAPSGGGPGFASAGLSSGATELTVGQGLLCFRPRVTGAQQVSRIEARGWDMTQKQAVTHVADVSTSSVSLQESGWSPSELAGVFGGQSFLTCERPISSVDEARALADSTVARVASSFAEAEGMAEGDPRIVTGGVLRIAGAGPFDGEYLVSHTRHRFDDDGYHTDFEVAGGQERSLLGLASLGATTGGAPPIHGAVIGLVTNTQDPQAIARVKLKFPWLGDDYESDWARVAYPGAGSDRGFIVVPEVGDEVLVIFERGDMRRPYVLGGLYNGQDAVPSNDYCDGSDGSVRTRSWVSRRGHQISISDAEGDERIVLRTGSGEYGITISESDDQISVTSSGKIVLDGPGGIELTGGEIRLSGSMIKVEADSNLELSGGNATIESSGQTRIAGSLVTIN
ncbi:MAG: VgrG-related protein [Ilumatobacteraceae bacterium]